MDINTLLSSNVLSAEKQAELTAYLTAADDALKKAAPKPIPQDIPTTHPEEVTPTDEVKKEELLKMLSSQGLTRGDL